MNTNREPAAGTPESHWGTKDPANQADRDDIVGLQRLVAETWTRMGSEASPDRILAELRERGVAATREQVEQCCPKPG